MAGSRYLLCIVLPPVLHGVGMNTAEEYMWIIRLADHPLNRTYRFPLRAASPPIERILNYMLDNGSSYGGVTCSDCLYVSQQSRRVCREDPGEMDLRTS